MEALTTRRARFVKSTTFRRRCTSVFMSGKAAMIFARADFVNVHCKTILTAARTDFDCRDLQFLNVRTSNFPV
jgi:hypothetical protein